mmetsp:Transcript_5664/g.8697  ORF Transcript_5664/g.8697 Transcript_5664/m.8697 type:complete len:199 (+) Transcript_5664:190-786(+)
MTNGSSDKVRGKLAAAVARKNSQEGIARLAHGVREEVRLYVRTGKTDLKFGVVELGLVKAHWFLGNAGQCAWIMTDSEPRIMRKGDPKYVTRTKDNLVTTMEEDGVDVIFLGGRHPPRDGRFRRNKDLRGAVWVTKHHAPGRLRVPNGWQVTSKRVSHSNVGGVTDVSFWVEVVIKESAGLSWDPQKNFVGNVLKQRR